MLSWLAMNGGTIVVSLGLLTVVVAIGRKLRNDKKEGKTSCGCGCSGCGGNCSCHNSGV